MRTVFLAVMMGSVCPFAILGQTIAPADIPEARTSDLQKTADELIRANDFVAAIPYLEELDARLQSTSVESSLRIHEKILFFLGLGYMNDEEFTDAVAVFKRFEEKYPQSNKARYAVDYLGDCYRLLAQYDNAAATYARLRKEYTLETKFDMEVLSKQATCHVIPRNWENALPLLEELLSRARDPDIKGKAATAMVQAYLQLERVNDILQLLPTLLDIRSARHNVDFNLVIIQGGDQLYYKEDYAKALLLYQLALPKEELMGYIEDQVGHFEKLRTESMQDQDFRMATAIREHLRDLHGQEDDLLQTDSYSEQLRFRIAQTYFELGRRWEALWVYWGVWKDYPKSEFAEDALFAAFSIASELLMYDRALTLGFAYMEKFENGTYYDEVSYQLTQVYVRRFEFRKAIDLAKKALEVSPEHTFVAQLSFVIGYCYFQMEAFDEALDTFLTLRNEHPESETREACDYWIGMTHLFKEQYDIAMDEFAEFVERYIGGIYYEDARFRVGVCHYGRAEMDEARKIFDRFVREFPLHPLRAEAHVFLGDIAGADGRLDDAMEHYKKVERHTDNMSQINYATFQVGKIQELTGQFEDMAIYFRRYLDKYRLEGNYAEAVWRIGFAKQQLGDIEEMHHMYESAIQRFGNTPSAIGIDHIMQTYPLSYLEYHGKEPLPVLLDMLENARKKERRALELRLERIIASLDSAANRKPPKLTQEDLKEASPAVLIWFGDISDDEAFVRTAYERVLTEYADTEWVEEALLALADLEAEKGNYDNAITRYMELLERFPQSLHAALATKRQGDLLAEQNKYEEARQQYLKVLEVKEWRGPLWPECLFLIGQSHMDEGGLREAYGYFQRVYVLYQGYPEWAAQSYLQSGLCLEKLNRRQDAIDTYEELLAMEDLKDTPAYTEAERRLETLL